MGAGLIGYAALLQERQDLADTSRLQKCLSCRLVSSRWSQSLSQRGPSFCGLRGQLAREGRCEQQSQHTRPDDFLPIAGPERICAAIGRRPSPTITVCSEMPTAPRLGGSIGNHSHHRGIVVGAGSWRVSDRLPRSPRSGDPPSPSCRSGSGSGAAGPSPVHFAFTWAVPPVNSIGVEHRHHFSHSASGAVPKPMQPRSVDPSQQHQATKGRRHDWPHLRPSCHIAISQTLRRRA